MNEIIKVENKMECDENHTPDFSVKIRLYEKIIEELKDIGIIKERK